MERVRIVASCLRHRAMCVDVDEVFDLCAVRTVEVLTREEDGHTSLEMGSGNRIDGSENRVVACRTVQEFPNVFVGLVSRETLSD